MSKLIITEAEQNLSKIKNEILYASYNLSSLAQDILQLLIAQIRNEDTELYTFRMYFKDIQKGLKRRFEMNYLKAACKELYSVDIELKTKEGTRNMHWLSETFFNEKDKYVDFIFCPKMKNYLLNLVEIGRFTIIDSKYFFNIKSSYAKRVYMILKNMSDIAIDTKNMKGGYYLTSISNLKFILNIEEGSYTNFSDFNKRVLKMIESQINKNSDLEIELKLFKKERKVTAVAFIIKRTIEKVEKKQKKANKEQLETILDSNTGVYAVQAWLDEQEAF